MSEERAMKKRLIVIAGVLAFSAAVALLVLWLLPVCPGVTKANFDRIEIGMTLSEVEAILGDDRGSRATFGSDINPPDARGRAGWGGEDGVAFIGFDMHWRVVHTDWLDLPLTLSERFRRRLP
jgi:hypothetical protein